MPIYEFKCAKCDHLEEVLQKFSDPPPNPCPHCGAKKSMSKAVSMTSFQLKGGGWYSDLYSSVPKGADKGSGDGVGGDKGDKGDKGGEKSAATGGKGDAAAKPATDKSDKKPKKKASGGKSGD